MATEKVTIKPETIPATEWAELASATGTDLETVGKRVESVARFMAKHAGLSSRDAADYMAANYSDGALSHTTIAQHVRLFGLFEEHTTTETRSARLIGMARSVFGFVRYSWERFDGAIGMAELSAMTEHDGERAAAFVRAVESAYAESKSTETREAVEAEREAEREAAKSKREAAKAEAEAKLTAEATERAERAEAEAAELRANVIRADGSPEAWDTFAGLMLGFAEHAETMTETAYSVLRLLWETAESTRAEAARRAAETAKPKSETAPKPRAPRQSRAKREAVAA